MQVGGSVREQRYLGVDMGGSTTRAHLLQAPAEPLSWQAPGGNIALDPEAALAILLPMVRETGPQAVCFGLAGARTAPAAMARLAAELRSSDCRATLMSDAELAVSAAFGAGADGIVICAGTGSVAVARRDGAIQVLGGHGFLLGDGGSAYDIGRRLIAATLTDRDRGGRSLTEEVEQFLGEPLNDFVIRVYANPADRAPLARLARHVPALQHEVASGILREAAEALVELATIAQRRYGPLPVRLIGGVFGIPLIADALRTRCGAARADTLPEVAAARLAAEAGA